MDDRLLSYRSEVSEDEHLLDLVIPENYELALGSILLPDESLLYKEKPSKHKIGKRNFIYLTLTLVALLYIPFVSIAFSVVAFSVPSVRNTEGMFMLGLMLFDIVLILVWLGYYHTLSECYVITNR